MVRITGADVLEHITDEELINASDLTEFSVTAADRAIESAEAAGKRGAACREVRLGKRRVSGT